MDARDPHGSRTADRNRRRRNAGQLAAGADARSSATWLDGAAARARGSTPTRRSSRGRTPRRLTVRVARVAERQTDLEEVRHRPARVAPRSAPDGAPTPAAVGFAKKNGVDVAALERDRDAEGHLSRRSASSSAARPRSTRCPTCCHGLLRGLAFPKAMRWDACARRRQGRAAFGRPIRWLLFLYGGRVVPFDIRRTESRRRRSCRKSRSGAMTYGHRFLTTSGRAGRAVKVKTFDDYTSAPARALRRARSRGAARPHRARARRPRRPPGRPRAPRGVAAGGLLERGAGSRRVTRRSSPAPSPRSSSRCPKKC